MTTTSNSTDDNRKSCSINRDKTDNMTGFQQGHPTSIFGKINICSEDHLRSRISGTFVVKFLASLPPLGFSTHAVFVECAKPNCIYYVQHFLSGLVHTRNPGRSPSSSSNTLILVLAISGSILVVFIVLCIIYLLWRLKNNKRSRIGADVRGIEGGGFELQDIV